MPSIDLNADVGEGDPLLDEQILRVVTSASIACGGHAGDLDSMKRTAVVALAHGVRIGAHPSYPDRGGFGRHTMLMEESELHDSIVDQIETLSRACEGVGAVVAYVKPHGALYNDCAFDPNLAEPLIRACAERNLPLMMLAGSNLAMTTKHALIREGFADRAYLPDGSLAPRSHPAALIIDPARASVQALRLAGAVDSLCVHSDTPGAAAIVKQVRARLEAEGYEVRA